MFKQLEEIAIKLDKSLNEINEHSLIIYELRLEIKRYEEESKKDKELIKKLIEKNKIEVREITHIIKGDSKKKPLVKYRYELEIKPYIERHIFKYEENIVYKVHKNKGHKLIKDDDLLTRFCGDIMGDHDTAYIIMEAETMSVTFILADI